MRNSIHNEAVELLLSSMSQKSGDGLQTSFFFGKPGARHWEKNFGVDFYYKANKLNRAALYVREKGPAYLKYLAISDIWGLLQRFVQENYWYLIEDAFLKQFDGSYAENVSAGAKLNFAEAIAVSEIFQPRDQLTIFPLVPVKITTDFDSDTFFLIKPSSLNESKLPSTINIRQIASDRFPPLVDFKGRQELPNAWLGVRSPAIQASNKIKAAILGALALTPLPRYRHSFSGRRVFGGRCTFSDAVTCH